MGCADIDIQLERTAEDPTSAGVILYPGYSNRALALAQVSAPTCLVLGGSPNDLANHAEDYFRTSDFANILQRHVTVDEIRLQAGSAL